MTRFDAVMAVSRMTAHAKLPQTTFHEFYGRGEIVQTANVARRDLNIKGLAVFDLRVVRPDGKFWDLSPQPSERSFGHC